VKLANLAKGALVAEAGGTFVGVEAAEAIWIHAYDDGLAYDASLGSCMVLLHKIDIQARPFEGWLPLVTEDGATIGRVAVQIFGDWAERLTVAVLRAAVSDRADVTVRGEPFAEVRVRDERRRTAQHATAHAPVWEERFAFFVGARDKLTIAVYDAPAGAGASAEEPLGTAEVLGIDALNRKGEPMWVPLTNRAGVKTCKVLVQVDEDQWAMRLPVRILQAKGLAAADVGPADLAVEGRCGAQEVKTTARPNLTDVVWDEEFLLEARKFDALSLALKSKDTTLAQAFIPVSELLAHSGEQVWVDLSGTDGTHGKLLLWVQPPPGSVYPDTLPRRRLVVYEDWDGASKLPPASNGVAA
jgi:hypothetical protein